MLERPAVAVRLAVTTERTRGAAGRGDSSDDDLSLADLTARARLDVVSEVESPEVFTQERCSRP